ncbi:Tr-type G domain-containing protein [Aphelenchoides bicaudatus]|nr:Tr-type G domain-containing protein [Aphelenchoides bicaudatus]
MIINYLPSPLEREYNIPEDIHTCGMVFKVSHDKRLGQLSFVRMYKGMLDKAKSMVVNNISNGAQLSESNIKFFVPFSDEIESIDHVDAHNIAVVSGLNKTVTGDTLLDASVLSKKAKEYFHFDGIEIPDAVFYCSVEPPNAGATVKLERALAEIVIEDPSFRVRQDAETGQTIVETMGELHAEVLKYRLKNDYKLDVFMGPLQISYREMIDTPCEYRAQVEDAFEDNRKQMCAIRFHIEPNEDLLQKFKTVNVRFEQDDHVPLRPDQLKAINAGCKNALFNGPVLGYPVQGVSIILTEFVTSGGRINPALVSACASNALNEALRKSGAYLIEPIMQMEVDVFDDGQTAAHSAIIQELTKRRATILGAQEEDLSTHTKKIRATMPLSETTGISTAIRKVSSGMASLHMELSGYQKVSPDQYHAMTQQRRHG